MMPCSTSIRVGEERRVPERAGPLCGRIGRGHELRDHVARSTPRRTVEVREIVGDGPRGLGIDVVAPVAAWDRAARIGIGGDQAGVDGETLGAHEAGRDAEGNDALERAAKRVAVAEALVAGAREGRMIGDAVFEREAAEPAIGKVHQHFAAMRAFRADREHAAENEHAQDQHRIDRRAAGVGVVGSEIASNPRQIEHAIDGANLMIGGHRRIEIESVEQLPLIAFEPPHHRQPPGDNHPGTRNHCSFRGSTEFCNKIGRSTAGNPVNRQWRICPGQPPA